MLFLMMPSFCLKNASGPNDIADVVGHIRSYIWSTDRHTALAPLAVLLQLRKNRSQLEAQGLPHKINNIRLQLNPYQCITLCLYIQPLPDLNYVCIPSLFLGASRQSMTNLQNRTTFMSRD